MRSIGQRFFPGFLSTESLIQRVFTQIPLLGLFLSPELLANPEFRFGRDFSGLLLQPRSSLTVIYNAGTAEKPNFRMATPAVVPVTREGKIVWFPDETWRREPFLGTDRVVIEQDMLGADANGRYAFPGCVPKNGEKLVTDRGVAWLASCPESVTTAIDSKSRRVVYDPTNAQIVSRNYTYKFKQDNYMLFDAINLKGATDFTVSRDSHLYIRSDVKNFFSLNFSSSDIESDLRHKRIDHLAAFASLGFYLKVLFFKITLDLSTDVGFFESSANIPMVMTLPVNAYDRLHRKSGVLYNFVLGDNIDPKSLKVKMPVLDPKTITGDFQNVGLNYCRETCVYELEIPNPVKALKMRINIRRDLVERGMFPWFVDDVGKYREAMNWKIENYKNRTGLYFEVSKLPKGSHPWDFWLSF